MKILLVNSLYAPNFVGGAERSVQALAEGLRDLGHEIIVVSTAERKTNAHDSINGVSVHYLAFKNRYWTYADEGASRFAKAAWHVSDTDNRAMADELATIVRDERPDVAHTNNLVGISVAAWDAMHGFGIPIVHTLRDYYLMCPKSTMFSHGRNCERSCAGCALFSIRRRLASQKVSAVVGVSEFIVRKHRKNGYFPRAQAALAIHTGYDSPPNPRPARTIEAGRLVVGFLGALSPNKGIDALLEAIETFPADRVTCLVAGKGRLEYELALKRKHDRPNVQFLGSVKASEFLPTIDVLVVPSLWEEPLARVLIESLAAGTPVVTTSRGGSPEIVRDGLDGIVTEGDSVAAIRSAIGRLIDDRGLLPRLRENAAARPQTNTEHAMAERYEQLYQSVCSRDRDSSRLSSPITD